MNTNIKKCIIFTCYTYITQYAQTQGQFTHQEDNIKPPMVETELQLTQYFSDDLPVMVDHVIRSCDHSEH